MINCSYCGEPVKPWTSKHGDLFTHICYECTQSSKLLRKAMTQCDHCEEEKP